MRLGLAGVACRFGVTFALRRGKPAGGAGKILGQGGHSAAAAARNGVRALPNITRPALDLARAEMLAADLAPVAVNFAAGHDQQKRLPHRS